MKKKIFLSLLVILSLVLVVGCGKKEAIAGSWTGTTADSLKMEVTLTFENGKFTYKNSSATVEGTYTIEDNKVTIECDDWSKEKVYEYEIKDGKLSLTATDLFSPSYKDLEKK